MATLAELIRAHGEQTDIFDKPARFYGWIRRVRGGKLPFIDVYDGTTCGSLMGLGHVDYYKGSEYKDEEQLTSDELEFKVLDFEHLSQADFLSPGCAVVLDGI